MTPPGPRSSARAWDNFDFQLTKHHEGEHEIAWPALVQVGVTQQMIDQMDAEHEVMAGGFGRPRLYGRPAPARTAGEGADRPHRDGQLKTVTIEHLDHEERELEPVYQSKRDDPAIKEMGKKFSKVGPKEGGVFFAWLTDGILPRARRASTRPSRPRSARSSRALLGRSYKKDVAPDSAD